MTEKKPVIADYKPAYKELRAGQTVRWCSCGQSKRQPYCDGRSHLGTGFEPVTYKACSNEEVLLCLCKNTCTPPFCDGSHSNLPGGYRDLAEKEMPKRTRAVAKGPDGVARLDGSCYVVSPRISVGRDFSIQELVSARLGAAHQSQFALTLRAGDSPWLSGSDGEIILWVQKGSGTILIGGTAFAFGELHGIYIRPGERFRLTAREPLLVYASTLSATTTLSLHPVRDLYFDTNFPERIVSIDAQGRRAMGPRFFQMLVDKRLGLANAAQFIGHIPRSRAEMHRHLYEEALIIVAGDGVIWNESARATVTTGDVIFFPRKQIHTLEATGAAGLDVVGFIAPGSNPGINY